MATSEIMDIVMDNTFRSTADLYDPRASALLQPSFEGLPATLFVIGEFDPLRDDSYGNHFESLERQV